jgi:predicted nuclease of predicted toxin-antitoxin system
VKFLIDMPLSPGLAVWLRGLAHDAVHAADIGLQRATDIDIMERARQDARVVVTADLDCQHLLALTRATEPGVILFRDGEWSEADVITRMDELLTALPEQDLPHSIIVVEKNRIRRRRLPLG